MTLEFKFPSNQTNLLALEGALYKIKISYDEESVDRNLALVRDGLVDIVRDELEEAVRVLCLMFMRGSALKRVRSCHFTFRAIHKPWKAARKLKFKANGRALNVCPDVLEITVSTRVTPSVTFKECVHRHILIDSSSGYLRNNESMESEHRKEPEKQAENTGKSTASPTKRKGSPHSKKGAKKLRKNNNPNNSLELKNRELPCNSTRPVTRQAANKSPRKKSLFSSAISGSESADAENQQVSTNARYNLRRSGNTNNSNLKPVKFTEDSEQSVQNPLYNESDRPISTNGQTRQLRSRRPLLKKSRLDQFVVQEEEVAEERKLQQLAQPLKTGAKSASKSAWPVQSPGSRKKAQKRSSLTSALDFIMTPFKYFTRSNTTT